MLRTLPLNSPRSGFLFNKRFFISDRTVSLSNTAADDTQNLTLFLGFSLQMSRGGIVKTGPLVSPPGLGVSAIPKASAPASAAVYSQSPTAAAPEWPSPGPPRTVEQISELMSGVFPRGDDMKLIYSLPAVTRTSDEYQITARIPMCFIVPTGKNSAHWADVDMQAIRARMFGRVPSGTSPDIQLLRASIVNVVDTGFNPVSAELQYTDPLSVLDFPELNGEYNHDTSIIRAMAKLYDVPLQEQTTAELPVRAPSDFRSEAIQAAFDGKEPDSSDPDVLATLAAKMKYLHSEYEKRRLAFVKPALPTAALPGKRTRRLITRHQQLYASFKTQASGIYSPLVAGKTCELYDDMLPAHIRSHALAGHSKFEDSKWLSAAVAVARSAPLELASLERACSVFNRCHNRANSSGGSPDWKLATTETEFRHFHHTLGDAKTDTAYIKSAKSLRDSGVLDSRLSLRGSLGVLLRPILHREIFSSSAQNNQYFQFDLELVFVPSGGVAFPKPEYVAVHELKAQIRADSAAAPAPSSSKPVSVAASK